MRNFKLTLILPMLLLSGCSIAVRREVVVERAGTVVTITKDVKAEALVPDSHSDLVPATIVIPRGSQCKIGQPIAPVASPSKDAPK